MEDEINSNDKTCIIIETFYENNNNNIENNLFACTSCDYQSKIKSNFKKHLAFKHDIGVRMEIYVALSQKLREYSSKNKFNESHIHIYYMFYSKDNPIIAKNIPYTMIYSMHDVEKLVL